MMWNLQSSFPTDLTIKARAHKRSTTATKLITAKTMATELTVGPRDSIMVIIKHKTKEGQKCKQERNGQEFTRFEPPVYWGDWASS